MKNRSPPLHSSLTLSFTFSPRAHRANIISPRLRHHRYSSRASRKNFSPNAIPLVPSPTKSALRKKNPRVVANSIHLSPLPLWERKKKASLKNRRRRAARGRKTRRGRKTPTKSESKAAGYMLEKMETTTTSTEKKRDLGEVTARSAVRDFVSDVAERLYFSGC